MTIGCRWAAVLLVAAVTFGGWAHADTIQIGSNTRDSVSLLPFDDISGTTRYGYGAVRGTEPGTLVANRDCPAGSRVRRGGATTIRPRRATEEPGSVPRPAPRCTADGQGAPHTGCADRC